MSLVVPILGMHRSGTSYLAGVLNKAGLHLGSDLMDDHAPANLDGHFEALEAVRINDDILKFSGGGWDHVPAEIRANSETPARIEAFLRQLCSAPVVGWKDPRTTVTFPLWRSHLQQCRVIACVRHPVSVARSLHVREGWPLERGLDLWVAYNQRLLNVVANEKQVLWFDFDLPEAELGQVVASIVESLGLSVQSIDWDRFNPHMRHQRMEHAPLPSAVQRVYDVLKTRALDGRVQTTVQGAKPSESPHGQTNPPDTGNNRQLNQLSTIQNKHNELLQAIPRSLHAVEVDLQNTALELRRVTVQFQKELADLEARLTKVEGRVFANVVIRSSKKAAQLASRVFRRAS